MIYRIRNHIHPVSRINHIIYPLYDFTHCISDSIEEVSYSLCTLEFEIRRDLYYYILDRLCLYKPYVYEYSRLNVSKSVLSKRRIGALVREGIVEGWSDPRLLTINGLINRGVTREAISLFLDAV